MEPEIIDLIRNARKNRLGKVRNKVYIFLICIILAVFIWALVRLSKDYYHNIDFTVRYINVPENYVLVNHPDSVITVKVMVQGYDLFSSTFLSKKNRMMDINLHRIRIKPYDNEMYRGIILTSNLGKEISAQFGIPSDIYSISPDTLFFFFEKKNVRKTTTIQQIHSIGIMGREDSIRLRNDSIREGMIRKQTKPAPKKIRK